MVRVLMRQEKTMKVICNHVADPRIVLKPNAGSDRSWVWNAYDFTEGQLEETTFALRFANSDSANDFLEVSFSLEQKGEGAARMSVGRGRLKSKNITSAVKVYGSDAHAHHRAFVRLERDSSRMMQQFKSAQKVLKDLMVAGEAAAPDASSAQETSAPTGGWYWCTPPSNESITYRAALTPCSETCHEHEHKDLPPAPHSALAK